MRLPGDKSLSHRALMLAALADGPSRLANLSPGDDVQATRRCLERCGIAITEEGRETVVEGRGGAFDAPRSDLDCGNSGTTARLLTGLLAGRGIPARLTGDASLSRRPMDRIVAPLTQLGARLKLSPEGTLPLEIRPARLGGLDYRIPVPSAQVKSALLLAGLAAEGVVTLRESLPTRDHTERLLQALGVAITSSQQRIVLEAGPHQIAPFRLDVPGDPSSAAFLTALALLLPGTGLSFGHLLLNPTRLGFYRALKRMGAQVSWTPQWTALGEPVGELTAQASAFSGIALEATDLPDLIDELPILAVLASQAQGETVVRGAAELRVKESDRIRAICENLDAMGGRVEELPDGFRIKGPTPLSGAAISTYGDHRIAMAFTVAGRISATPVTLDQPGCIDASFPGFHDLLAQVKPGRMVVAT